jgi:hypothetical protein
MAEKKLALVSLPLCIGLLAGSFLACERMSTDRRTTVWGLLLDISDGRALAMWTPLLILTFSTAVYMVMVVQLIAAWRHKGRNGHARIERHKQQPRRRKDYR